MTVIIILAILTLIALPLVGDVAGSTAEATLRGNLASLRNAIELYANEHDGKYPAALTDGTNAAGSEATFVSQLTQYSNASGVVLNAASASFPYGPYLKLGIPKVTVGALSGAATVNVTSSASALSADGSPTKAWKYSYTTGQLICNSSTVSSDGSTPFSSF